MPIHVLPFLKRVLAVVFSIQALVASAQNYQWSADVKGIISPETGDAPIGYLWIPAQCDNIRALMFAFQNMTEEALFLSPSFREKMAHDKVALLWIAPGFGQEWDVSTGVQESFDRLIDDLAWKSGHDELRKVPLIPFGHSAQATMPWNFAAWNPDRTLCVISFHGDAPRTNLCGYGRANLEWGRTRNIDGIPGLMVMGEYEWWDARIRPALAFRIMYPGSCVSFLGDAGRGHFDLSDRTADYIARFIEKSIDTRLSQSGLVPISPHDGWLAQAWEPDQGVRHRCAPWNEYDGCRHETFWYFDREMAELAEERYAETTGKEPCWLGFMSDDGKLLRYNKDAHCKMTAEIVPRGDDTFSLKAVFTDSSRTIADTTMSQRPVRIRYISGAVVALNDSTFSIDRQHPTWNNPRRRGRVTLCAESQATSTHKEAVQEIEVIIVDNPQ